MIKFQEQHEPGFTHVAIDHLFQLGEGALRLGRIRKRGKIELPDTGFQ